MQFRNVTFVLVLVVWSGFLAFGLFDAPRLARLYEAFDVEIPFACQASVTIARWGVLLLPLPALYFWRRPTGPVGGACGLALIGLPVFVVLLARWPVVLLVEALQ